MITQSESSNHLVTQGLVATVIVAAIALILYLFFRGRQKSDDALESTQEVDLEVIEATQDLSKPTPAKEEPALKKKPEPIILGELLRNTRQGFLGRIQNLFAGEGNIPKEKLADLEEILFTSDLGPRTVETLMSAVHDKSETLSFDSVKEALREKMTDIFSRAKETNLNSEKIFSDPVPHKPWVLMIVGVNGVGKTTTIGKLAKKFAENGKKVLVAAGDTFRAAAQDQLAVWSSRAEVEIHSPKGVTDPAAVAFSACEKARNQSFDVLIIDTAGRLHTKSNLMEELKKMKRVIEKALSGAPHEVLLVVDANTGQNALNQARTFHDALGVTGVVLTKLDGTAKGGVAVGIACELQIPIVWIGVGEKAQDLKNFLPQEFVTSII